LVGKARHWNTLGINIGKALRELRGIFVFTLGLIFVLTWLMSWERGFGAESPGRDFLFFKVNMVVR
jgi:hypothetical protein